MNKLTTMRAFSNSIRRLTPQNTIFLECDVQKVFAKHIFKYPTMLHNSKRMTQVSEILEIPVVATRHVKKAFKDIDEAIPQVDNRVIFDKSLFSMLQPEVLDHMKTFDGKTEIVLYGIEAHVCMR